MRSRKAWASLGIGFLILLLSASPGHAFAQGASGVLDPAFGTNGFVLTPFGPSGEIAGVELGVAPDGSVVLGDGIEGRIVRLLPDGSPDGAFGTAGEVRVSPEATTGGVKGRTFFPRSIAVDGLGRVLVFGQEDNFGRSLRTGFGRGVPESSAVVLRLDPEGHPDPSFGEGKGFVRDNFGLRSGLRTHLPMVGVLAGGVDSHDRPVLVAGVEASRGTGCGGHSGSEMRPRAVVRLTESGLPDPRYGGGDGISGRIEGSTSVPSLGLDGRGGAVVGVGRIDSPRAECEPGTTLYRLRPNGGRMKSFGTDGVRVFTRYHLAFVEPSGAMILSDRHGRNLEVVRIGPDGGRDLSFGHHGVAEVRLPAMVDLHVRPVSVDARGRILLAGFIGSPIGSPRKGQARSSFVVARLRPDGRLDAAFGNHGWTFTRLPRPLEITGARAALDPQGRLLVAGTVFKKPERAPAFAVARYLLGP